ncbi:MAG: polysaccharide biosynthesis tyrosine autokinase [Pseudomonadota bacterium]
MNHHAPPLLLGPAQRPPAPSQPAAGHDLTLDIANAAARLWRGKWTLVTAVSVALLISAIAAARIDPVYRASAKVMFDIDGALSGLRTTGTDRRETSLQNEIEVLTSTRLIDRVVGDLGLVDTPEFNGQLAQNALTLPDRAAAWFGESGAIAERLRDWAVLPPQPKTSARTRNPETERRAVVADVRRRLTLRPVPGSKVIEIALTAKDPALAADVVNAIAETYIIDQLDARLDATRAATEWLSLRVQDMRERVEEAEQAVEVARIAQSETAGQSLAITRQQLGALGTALARTRSRAVAAEARFDRIAAALAQGSDFGAIPDFQTSRLIQAYRSRASTLSAEAAMLRRTLRPGHPSIAALEAQLAALATDISAEAGRVAEAARADLETARAETRALERDFAALEALEQEQTRADLTIRQLDREAEASRALYQNFLGRLKEASAEEDLQSANARVLSPAEPPLAPMGEARRRTLALGGMLGLLVGACIVLVRDRLSDTFLLPQQVETLTGVPLLGAIPSAGRRLSRREVIARFRQNPKSSLAEAVRSLRTSLLFSGTAKTPSVVMVTSSVPREGKSTTAMLLALTSRQMGRSAIIVDCDLRLPSLASILGADGDGPGLPSVLAGRAKPADAILRDPDTGLHALMTRPGEARLAASAADILASDRFAGLLERLRSQYDLVILDTPPVLVVADARILSSLVDAVLYAVRWNATARGAAADGLRELAQVGAPVAGVVVTEVEEERAARYEFGGHTYHKGRHRAYYSA